jgi:hypothetical protein
MQHKKVRKQPLNLGKMETTVLDVHGSHLPRHHDPSRLKLLGDVQLRRQPKNLSKLSKLHMEPSVISHPHKDPLFLVIEESGVELGDDFLIPVVPKWEQISDTMQVTSLKNPVKMHALLVPHILSIHILLLNHWRWLQIMHSSIPVLMKEGLESLISAPLLDQVVASLAAEMDRIQGILFAVVHNLSRGVNLQRMHLGALRLIGSTTTRWRDLGGGLHLVVAGSWSLGKLLGLGRGTTRGSTDIH